MNIFIDTISTTTNIILFNSDRAIINKYSGVIKGNESSSLIPRIDELLKSEKIDYTDLENIVVVNGPGSFTGVRTTVLAINTINYIIKKNITAKNYFELYDNYPIIKSSSKRDCFVQFDSKSEIQIINNTELLEILNNKNISKIYGEVNTELFPNIELLENIDYLSIIKKLKFDNKKQIDPLYIKKPNIS